MPEISVIIPMYKTPKLRLRKCLESLMEQTFNDFEILVIDDGNEPGYEYLKVEYEKKDSRIVFIRQEHSGVSNARNLGIKIAKGKFISFVDSDDFVDPSFLKELHDAIQDSDMAICAVSEQYYPVCPGWTDQRVFWSKPSYYNGLQYINFCHNKMYRADIIRENHIQFRSGMKLGEDAIFLADYMQKCRSFRMVREPRYHYVPDGNSAVNRYRKEYWEWEQLVIQRQWDMFHVYPLSTFEEQAMEHWLYEKLKYTFFYYITRENDRNSRKEMLREICSSNLFKVLTECSMKNDHRHLNRKNRTIIWFWRQFGVRGVEFVYMIRRIYWYFRR